MENNKKIYEAMASIMEEIEAVKKSKNNQQQGFKYRSIDDVMNALHDSFAKNKVFISFKVIERNTETFEQNNKLLFKIGMLIEYTFTAIDGSSISTTIYSESLDFGDKGTGKALSYALKYVLMQMFLIPTEDAKDNDAESIEVAKKTVQSTGNSMPENKRIEALQKIKEAQNADALKAIYEEYKQYYGTIKDALAQRRKELTQQ